MSAIPRDQVEDMHALSPVQQGMFFHALLEPELAPYVTQGLWRLQGRVAPALFARAWQELVARHPVLRSVFRQARRQPVQIVLAPQPIDLSLHDWTSRSPDDQRAALSELARAGRAPFRLADGPLFRLSLVQLGPEEWRLLWTFHHIILDGLSVGLLLDGLCRLYDTLAAGEPLPAAEVAPFGRFMGWLAQQDRDEAIRFWSSQLDGVRAPTALPYDRRPTSVAGRSHRARHAWIDRDTSRALGALARRHRVTLARIVHAAWALLLARHSGEPEVVFGVTLAGRPTDLPDIERIAGPFINTVPVRVSLADDPPLADLLRTLQRQFFDIEPYSYVSLADIQGCTPITAPAKLFDSAINVHPPVDWNGFRTRTFTLGVASEEGPPLGRTNYDMMADVVLFDTIGVTISYVEEVFDAGTIDAWLECFTTLLASIAAGDGEARVSALALVSPRMRTRLVAAFNHLDTDAVAVPAFDGGIVSRIEAQTAAADAIAIVGPDETLCYGALNARANRLAAWLRTSGIGREDRVAILGARGAGLIAAMLGILKAGAAFVPLDPLLPDARLAAILAASQSRLLLCGPESAARARTLAEDTSGSPRTVCWTAAPAGVAMEDARAWADAPAGNPPHVTGPRDLACVFFTSGSTGRPKGAMVEHGGLLNHHAAKIAAFGIEPGSVVAQNAALGFDICVWQMLAALEAGGRVLVYDDDLAIDAERLVAALARDRVTLLETVPTLLAPILDATRRTALPALRLLISNAELLPVPLCRDWLARHPRVPIVNTYGATECSDDTTHHVQETAPADEMLRVPVGRPIPGARLYTVDRDLRPVPYGGAGEIATGGVAVGRGYLDDPIATALAFVPDPFASEPGARLYRSGDIGRWTRDGVLEFLGRNDDQVKVRGHRIELGEIQAALLRCDGVRQAAVVIGERVPGEPQCFAYWVGDAAAAIDAAGLREALAASLPAYMVPAAFVRLDALPLTPNGKVDRRALPVPSADDLSTAYVAPRAGDEEAIAEIWRVVLGVPRVGATDNFFELGGQSLKTLQIRLRLAQTFGLEVPMRAVFRHQTVRAQAQLVADLRCAARPSVARLPRLPEAASYALSRAQRRLWLVQQLDPGDTSYNLLEPLTLDGVLDLPAFEQAWSSLVARHESLRTTFAEIDGEPRQRIAPAAAIRLPHVDLAGADEDARESAVRRLLAEARDTPFALDAPLVRALVITLAPERHLFAVALHHLVSDAWSGDVLLRDFLALYRAARLGAEAALAPLPARYIDYAAWQTDRLASGGYADDEAFWLDRLRGELPAIAPALGSAPAAASEAEGEPASTHTRTFVLDAGTAARVRRAAAGRDLTPFMLRLALLKAALARLSGLEDLIVGAPVAGRDHPEVEALVGFFVNLLAFRTGVDGGAPFTDLLDRVGASCVEAYAHQDYPFDALVQRLNPARATGRVPIFDVLFTTFASGQAREAGGLTIAESASRRDGVPMVWPGANMAVALFAICREEPDGALAWALVFDAHRFDRASAGSLARRIETIMRAVADRPDAPLSSFETVTPAERDRITHAWNATATAYPRDETVHALVERRVAEAPEAIAVIDGDRRWTYRAINARANQLARHLIARGLEPGTLAGTLLDRSADLVIAQLAILKTGAAYLSLSPDDPPARTRFMLEDGRVALVVAARAFDDLARDLETAGWVRLDRDGPAIAAHAEANLPPCGDGGSLSHVMYTSGSTGRPKGAMLPHRGITRLLRENPELRIGPDDRLAQMASCLFDGATLEIWGALLNGARLVILTRETVLSPPALSAAFATHGITVATLTPVLFNQMARETPRAFAGLRHLFSGGDVMSTAAARRVREESAPARLSNGYGPTENSMFTTCHLVTPADDAAPVMPVGRPVANTQAYIVDADLRLVGAGVAGELLTGGDGLGQGYWDRPELTAAQFVPDPFGAAPGARLYRTGDLARWREDGAIEFLGRVDHQIKIRGHRIELGEVEAVLMEHPAIAAAAVTLRVADDGDRRLAAYVVAVTGTTLQADAVRQFASGRLPAYMVPAWIVLMPALPLTAGRKVDRQALPAPADDRAVCGGACVAPRDGVEEAIAAAWRELLGRSAIGVHDNFFEVGGHSLTTVRLRSRLSERFAIDLPLREVFEHQTIEAQAQAVAARVAAGTRPAPARVPRLPDREHYPLSHAQRRLWFLQRLHPGDTTYTVFAPIVFDGRLDMPAFARAFDALIARHASLRTSFDLVGSEPVQRISEAFRPDLERYDLSTLDADARRARALAIAKEMGETAFDLATPPIRAALLSLKSARHVLFLALHHGITDGWSWRLLVEDLGTAYRAACAGETPDLPPLALRYVDYAAWQQARLDSGALAEAEQYWLDRLRDAPPDLALSDEPPDDDGSPDAMRTVLVTSGAQAAEAMRRLGQAQGATPLMIRLALLAAFLARASGQDDLIVGTAVSGRDHADAESIVGFFVNILPIRIRLDDDPTFVELLDRVRRICLDAFAHQDYPFDLMVQRLNPSRNPDQLPFVQIMFTSDEALAPTLAGDVSIGGIERLPGSVGLEGGWSGSANGLRITCVEQGAELAWNLAYPARRLRTDAARRLLRQFAGFIEDVTQAPGTTLSAIDLRAECPLSAAQREVWQDCERHPVAAVAAASLQVVLRGPLDAVRWHAALQATIDRHDALRAAFHTAAAGAAVVQQIAPRARLDLPLVDLSTVEIGAQARALDAIAHALAGEAFDLAAPPLVRARLVRTAADAHVCLLVAHRLVIDPHDLPRLACETLQSYAQPAAGPAMPNLQYADFVSWQDGRLRGGAFARQAQVLRRLLQSPPPDTSWPVERPVPAVRTFETAHCRRTIAPDLLRALARPGGASAEASVVAMFAALVGRMTGQTDLLAGLRLSSAPKAFEPLLGTFAQRLPLRITIDDRRTFTDLARDVETRLADLHSRRETPGTLVHADEPRPDPPAFAVAVERVALAASAAGDLRVQADLPVAASGSEMLTLVIVSTGDGLDLALRYPVELFEAAAVRCWTEAIVSGLADAAMRPDAAVGALELLGATDREWLVRTLNATAAPLSADVTVHALVDAQAARRPEAIAVIDGRTRWTYGQLTTEANRLARHLASRGVEPGTLVATVLERSAALVIAQLAILKAGAAYLPLHPEDPRERLAFMLADGRVRCVIADGRTQAAVDVPSDGMTLIDLGRDAAAIAACPDTAPRPRGNADSLAYVAYTSGSTGRPKGAMIPHRGIVRLVCGTRGVPIGPEDVLPYAANVSFDAATFEVWGALANGARLVICPHEMVLSPAALLETFATQGVTIAFLTAALFHQIVRERPSAFARLCHLVTGGDVVGPRAARHVLEEGAPGQLWNAYGPTENTTFTTIVPITIESTSLPTLPIGRPIANTTVYVVDRELRPVAIGVTGELCTGGAGLADGYWERPVLTAGHFVPDPFSDRPGARLYCTGDAARWRADGTIEFVGRIDQQVKIHGRRVEPGEIEAVLCRHATVAEAIVIVRDRGDGLKTLAAYVVPASGTFVAADVLRRHVAASLPAYMVPAWIVPLAAFPLTPTGKVDRRALPPPEPARPADAAASAEPRTPLARAIAEVWKEALHVDRVGLDDNFFDLGGDSVLCIVAVSHLAERGIHTTPKELYAHATVAALAEVVGQAARAARGPERAVSGTVPLLPIQRFFFELGLEQSHHWNAGTLMRAERLDVVALRTALQALLDRHDALRMRFANGPDGWTQHNPPPGEAICFEEVDLSDAAARLTSECTRVQASLDYVNGPIFRAALFRLPDGTDRLLLVAHHLVSDMVSGRIIYEDLQRAYDQAVRGEPVVLPARTTSFQHWGELLLAHAPSRLHELSYWQAIADGIVPSMPVDHDLGDNTMETVAHVQVELDAETTRTLLTRARPAFGVEMHDLLIAALARTLGAWNGQAALPFLVEGHGREDIFDGVDLTRTVGWFTAMYPVRLETGRGRDLAAHIHRVRDTLRDVPDRGLAYGLLRFLLGRPELAGPLPEVSFNYHGQFSVAPAARFGVAQESAGVYTGTRGRRFSLLNVECWVGSGCLRAAVLYSRNKHRAETLTAMLRQFLDELRATADVSLESAAKTELAGRSAESRETLAAEV